MSSNVIIRIINHEHIDYLIQDATDETISSGSAFHPDQLPEFPSLAHSTLIVPGENVLLLTVQLPKMSRSQLIKALPFALEEQLIDDPEDLHFVPGKQEIDGSVIVAVVKKQLMTSWLQQCRELNVFPKSILPDYLAVAYVPEALHLYLDNDRVLIRQAELQGMSIEHSQLTNMLELAVTETQRAMLQEIVVDYDDGNEHFDEASLQTLALPVQLAAADTFCMQLFVEGLKQKPALNLLQGEFNANKPASKGINIWRWATIFFAAWLVIWLASNITQYFVYKHRLNKTNVQISTLYKKAFPDARSQVDPRLRIQRALDAQRSTGSGGHFLSLLTQVGKQISTQKSAVTIENFNYTNGSLILSVSTDNFQTLASFTSTLRQQGLTAEQQNSATQGNKVTARVTVKGGQ
jgi:general secretion pathway protein L